VALARAVAYAPQLLLMDEPLGALDLKLREAMQLELRRIQRELRITTLYVTHDQSEAMRISDRIAIMNGGRIEQLGSAAEIYETPASCFVADFLGKINLIPAETVAVTAGHLGVRSPLGELSLPVPDGVAAGNRVTLGIRPDVVIVNPGASANDTLIVSGTVVDRSFLGNIVELRVRLTDQIVLMVEAKAAGAGFAAGDNVRLGLPAAHFKVFAQ
jgi:spermidine/putrescine transport system ATP-binding protein